MGAAPAAEADRPHGRRPCVLVFSGADPSGGAGIAADILAIQAQGAHALPVITALTVQDNDRVYDVLPVEPDMVLRQARALMAKMTVDAVKIGIPGSAANARAIALLIAELHSAQRVYPEGATPHQALPVVLDPVLASGHGDLLSRGDAVQALAVLLPLVTLLTPNWPEAMALACGGEAAEASFAGVSADADVRRAAQVLLRQGCRHVLVTGGHSGGDAVINRWFSTMQEQSWSWPRLSGDFHGSGCTLAAAAAGLLAHGMPMQQALAHAQDYTHGALAAAFAIAPGQRIPHRL